MFSKNLVQPTRIELVSMVLQTTAMTTSAKVAWCIDKGLNLGPSPCKGAALPLSYQCINLIWVEPGNRTLSTCFTDKCATTTLGTTLFGAGYENRTHN